MAVDAGWITQELLTFITFKLCLISISYLSVCIRKSVGGLKLEDLPGLEALQIPGVILMACSF